MLTLSENVYLNYVCTTMLRREKEIKEIIEKIKEKDNYNNVCSNNYYESNIVSNNKQKN